MDDVVLVLPEQITASLQVLARQDVESAGVLIASIARTPSGLRLIGREFHAVPEDAYEMRKAEELRIRSAGYVPMLARAEQIRAVPMFIHTHVDTAASPCPSAHDDVVDKALAETFRLRSGADIYASLIVSVDDDGVKFTGRGRDGDSDFQVASLLTSGTRLSLRRSVVSPLPPLPEMFDRQVRAFGQDVQRVLGALRVGIVGCGGTGSAVAEQLVRLGVRHLVLLENDILTDKNVTRVYGSTPADVGLPKVHVLVHHLRSIAPDLEVRIVASFLKSEAATRQLTDCDVLFGCTDDNSGRLLLGRVAAYYLAPLIDCGVLISSDKGVIDGIHGRVTVQRPGAACLVCRGRVDQERARAELLHPEERRRLAAEGYAPELAGVEPAVVAFTSLIASQSVIELLDLLVGFGPEGHPTEVLHRVHDREVGVNVLPPRAGHYCDPDSREFGRGDVEPFLGRLWSNA